MIRTLTVTAGLAVSASAASAGLLGLEVRESAALNASASAAIGQEARVLRLFVMFDGAGLMGEDPAASPDPNELTAVANLDVAATTFSLTQGSFFQTPAPFGSNFAPDPGFLAFDPTLQFDSYLAVGIEPVDGIGSDARNNVMGITPDFIWDSNSLTGSWFNSAPGVNEFGAALGDPNGVNGAFSVFAGQFTVVGAGAGGDNVEFGPNRGGTGTTLSGNVGISELLRGDMQLGIRVPGAPGQRITFVPTPGALALFGVAGLAATRRRRSA